MALITLDLDDLVTSSEAAALAGVHVQTILRWLNSGDLKPTVTIKGTRLISKADLTKVAEEKAARYQPVGRAQA